jgi:hypothetical protein
MIVIFKRHDPRPEQRIFAVYYPRQNKQNGLSLKMNSLLTLIIEWPVEATKVDV